MVFMKIVCWNVNGIRAVDRKGDLWEMLAAEKPDIFLIQEVKGTPGKLPPQVETPDGYTVHYNYAEKAGYAGTGIWVRDGFEVSDIEFSIGMPKRIDDPEGRVVRMDCTWQGEPWSILGIYFPNGGKSEEAWGDKLVFYDEFLDYVNEIRAAGRKCIWAGDLNVNHQEIDLARPKENDGKIGFHPYEREWVDRVIEAGWVDVWRDRNPNKEGVYSWWHVISRARDRNVGWRIDYFFTDRILKKRIKIIEYRGDQMGSDHCPVICEVE